jgi:hypothetical protein
MMCMDGAQPDENCDCKSGEIDFFPEIPGGDGPLPVDLVLGAMVQTDGEPPYP